jgi:hypothetical protein
VTSLSFLTARASALRRPRIWLALLVSVPTIALAADRPSAVAAEPQAATDIRPFRNWYFAEGNSRPEFQTYFSLLNLSDQPASVMVYYDRDDGIRLVQWLGVAPNARLSFGANDIVGPRAFGASFFSDRDIVVERSTTWGPQQNGATSIGFSSADRRSWYFAEGTTRGLVSTYFVSRNLSDEPASVTATFTRDDGSVVRRAFTIPPRGRDAFRMNDLLKDTSFAAAFVADRELVVERTILSEGPTGVLGGPGYAPVGQEVGFRTWSFAEGSTRRPYITYFVLFNPNPEASRVQLRFRTEGGEALQHVLQLPGLRRIAFDPRDVLPGTDFATTISADRPIIAERTYYSTGDGLYGALGATPAQPRSGSRAWYFAEANTTGKIETYFLLSNLSDKPANVEASYFTDDGGAPKQSLAVPARGRVSIRANDTLPGRTFSARFLGDQDIVVERTFYFPGWSGFTTVGAGVGSP